VVDLRLYRVAFLPALVALVALLFSLQSLPQALSPLVSPATFDPSAAAGITRQIVKRAPVRTPGNPGDSTIADMVARAFGQVRGGEVIDQRFDGDFNGDTASMRNVVLRLHGVSDHIVALIAPRDTASGPGATSSAAATAALIELASDLGSSRHAKTILLASTDGSSAGAAGAKELASELLPSDKVDGVIVLSAAGAAQLQAPYLIDTSDGPNRTSVQLERTAERALHDQAAVSVHRPGALGQLADLAIPFGLGEQAPLIDRGIPAVALSTSGERPLPAAADGLDSLSPPRLAAFAQAAYDAVLSLDSQPSLEPSPDSYIELGGNLIPGWAISLLALGLILPALVAAVDGLARAARQGEAAAALAWAAPRSVPLIAALALLYLLAFIGIVTRPAFPFDPATIRLGAGEVAIVALLAAAGFAAWRRLGAGGVPATLDREAGATAAGLILVVSVLIIWLANPYLGLLAVPVAHAWIPRARAERRLARLRTGAAIVLAAAPVCLAIASVASRLDMGASLPWQALVMVGDGGVPLLIAFAGCLAVGSLTALLVVSSPPGRAWTDFRSGADVEPPINSVESRSRPEGGDQEERDALGREAEDFEAANRPGRIPGGRESGGERDPQEAEPDQPGSAGDGTSRS
jgi:hypothetical protein